MTKEFKDALDSPEHCLQKRELAVNRKTASDNSTSFQGDDNQLLDLGKLLQSKEQSEGVEVYPSNNLFEWKFIPPYAPHFGGLGEAVVKSMKYHLCRI
ncbi:hypothetical protein Cfor_04863 [Coptotermes formosanus]|uniref:Uncharacterized protein n=1 Tax=Coptotermes formosanus TaxID=36987 RepID=A0A6L2PU85_COPFO|nr:hypothetical protein Cfor_04863 [Coptotermes formosanus]